MHDNKKISKLEKENILGLEEEKEDKVNIKRYALFFIIFLIALYFSTFGITVSFYKGGSDKSQEIETNPTPTPTESPLPTESPTPTTPPAQDKIIFTYSDVDRSGSGINLVNAMPISDEKGKALIGTGNYFDFSVTATSKKNDLIYKILINKDQASTLANGDVRIYLTSVFGGYEKEVVLTSMDNLQKEKINGTDYYVLFIKRLEKGINNHTDFYRLRMWVKESSTDYNDKTYMLKVDVIAEQVGD
jgi:hypothetical protein